MSIAKWMNPDVAAIRPYEPGRPIEDMAREHGLAPAEICKLASNENPLGVSRLALRAMKRALPEMYLYPDGYGFELRQKLAARTGFAPGQFIFGSGSNEILEFIGHCYMGRDRSIVCSQYAFVVYKLVAQMFGSRILEVSAPTLGHDLPAMAKAIRPDTSIIFICNPNNPTGTLVTDAQVAKFMARVPEDVLVVFDEAYAEICLGKMPDTSRYLREGRNVLILRTFSKAYGMAGMRVGYAMGPAEIISALERARQPFNVNRLAQTGAVAALDDAGFLRRTRTLFRQGREMIEAACDEAGLEYQHSAANFMLIKVGDGTRVTAGLTKRGVIVRPMGGYGLPSYIRVSYGTLAENEKFISALRAETGK